MSKKKRSRKEKKQQDAKVKEISLQQPQQQSSKKKQKPNKKQRLLEKKKHDNEEQREQRESAKVDLPTVPPPNLPEIPPKECFEKREDKSNKHAAKQVKQNDEDAIESESIEKKQKKNPLLYHQEAFLATLNSTERHSLFSDDAVTPDRRAELWMQQAEIGEQLVNEYSWATPTPLALSIIAQFSPLIEIGCGRNAYWCRQLLLHCHGGGSSDNKNNKSSKRDGDAKGGGDKGVDIVGYDVNLESGGKIEHFLEEQEEEEGNNPENKNKKSSKNKEKKQHKHHHHHKKDKHHYTFVVQSGGPEVLLRPEHQKRTLFLCYPDESPLTMEQDESGAFIVKSREEQEEKKSIRNRDSDDDEKSNNDSDSNEDTSDDDDDDSAPEASLGLACLLNYTGEYVIHVGEIYSSQNLSVEQAPWGRSSGPEFQQCLASQFHCVLQLELPGWLHVRDTLTVWKRSELCTLVFSGGDDEEESDKDKNENDPVDEEEEVVQYRHIPSEERLPLTVAAPKYAHLLKLLGNHGGTSINDSIDTPFSSAAADAANAQATPNKKRRKNEVVKDEDDDSDNSSKSSEGGDYKTPW